MNSLIVCDRSWKNKLQNLSRWLWQYKATSQLPAEITQSALRFDTPMCLVSSEQTRVCGGYVFYVSVNWQQMVNTDQDKDQSFDPTTVPQGPVLPWWPGQGTCLPLLSRILRGQPHTQLEVRCHPGLSLRSPLTILQPLTSTNTETNWDWGRRVEGGGGRRWQN